MRGHRGDNARIMEWQSDMLRPLTEQLQGGDHMQALSYADAFQVLLLQLGNEGRDETLLGGCAEHAKEACIPFLVGKEFPDLYLEFPLKGEPFLDVTILYGQLEPGTRIDAPAAAGTEAILDW